MIIIVLTMFILGSLIVLIIVDYEYVQYICG